MTSEENNAHTVSFFKEHNYFGYDKNKIKFFMQGELPILTEDRKGSSRKWENKAGI